MDAPDIPRGINAAYPLSLDGLRRLHRDIEERGERQVGLDAGHPPILAARAAHWRYREMIRELKVDPADLSGEG